MPPQDALDQEINELEGEGRMPFREHLRELRRRLVFCLIAVACGFGVAYGFSKPVFRIMMKPLLDVLPEGQQLVYTGLPEAFFTYLKVGLYGGVILASPFIFYQIWQFVAPGLYKNERSYVVPFVVFATLLFLLGGFFGYFIVFPFGFKFFVGFSDEHLRALPAVKEYFSLALKLLFGFGVVFELPLVMVFLAKMGLVDAKGLRRFRKFALMLVFVVAAMLTPPDVISQVLMAAPLIILYEISIILVAIIVRRKKAKIEEMVAEEEDSES
jgi:sec-independent protein translocase protein TatC